MGKFGGKNLASIRGWVGSDIAVQGGSRTFGPRDDMLAATREHAGLVYAK